MAGLHRAVNLMNNLLNCLPQPLNVARDERRLVVCVYAYIYIYIHMYAIVHITICMCIYLYVCVYIYISKCFQKVQQHRIRLLFLEILLQTDECNLFVYTKGM